MRYISYSSIVDAPPMNHHDLEQLFNPKSIAVIGASDKSLSVGATVLNHLLHRQFLGHVFPVNPKHRSIQGEPCFSSVKDIPNPVDLAIIVTPAETVSEVLMECGEKGIRQAIILSAGFGEMSEKGGLLEKQLVQIAQQCHLRFIGPNCLGMMRPAMGLNATFQESDVLPGPLAFVSQSGALIAAILDWSTMANIGFSTVLSLGNHADLDFGEILDYLSTDPQTHCILLYIEGIHHARSFVNALQSAASLKPVLVIKAGRNVEGSKAAISHTGAMIGADDVFDAVLVRTGAIRVNNMNALLTATAVFSGPHRPKGSRLAIVTNGGGAGVMAADCAAELNIQLPELTQKTIEVLNHHLPNQGACRNPIDILGDATPNRYEQVVKACLNDDNYDAVLVILVPVAMSDPLKVADLLIELNQQTDKPIIACWLGEKLVRSSRARLAEHHIPNFSTPEMGMEAFSYLVRGMSHPRLSEDWSDRPHDDREIDLILTNQIIDHAIQEGRRVLTTLESKAILQAFGIPVTLTKLAKTAKEARAIAEAIGFPVVMKIASPDITHKQDVGGVQLNITHADGVSDVFHQLIANARHKEPHATIEGVTIERMIHSANDRELMVGVLCDPVFGPVIHFGAGGSLVEVMQDRALALPPLSRYWIQHLIARTHIATILGAFRGKPAVNMTAIEEVLLRVSTMVCELPNIQEMDINPLIVNEKEIFAVDARIVIHFDKPITPYGHLPIWSEITDGYS